MGRIAVLGALDREVRLIRRALNFPQRIDSSEYNGWTGTIGENEIVLVCTGMGSEQTAPIARKVLNRFSPQAVLSIGFACALHPDIRVGDLILSEEVVSVHDKGSSLGDTVKADQDLQDRFLKATNAKLTDKGSEQSISVSGIGRPLVSTGLSDGIAVYRGLILSVEHILKSSLEKKEFAQRHRALGADMESAVVGKEAKRKKIPFLSVRGVSDLFDEDLQIDFDRLIYPDGSVRKIKGSFYLITHPRIIFSLGHMRFNAKVAARNLSSGVLRYLRYH